MYQAFPPWLKGLGTRLDSCVFEHAPYAVIIFLCESGGNCGKLVSPPFLQYMAAESQEHSGGQDCAVDVRKPASSTSRIGRVTDQPNPACRGYWWSRYIPLSARDQSTQGKWCSAARLWMWVHSLAARPSLSPLEMKERKRRGRGGSSKICTKKDSNWPIRPESCSCQWLHRYHNSRFRTTEN